MAFKNEVKRLLASVPLDDELLYGKTASSPSTDKGNQIPEDQTPYYVVKPLSGKGFGAVASTFISAYQPILEERVAMTMLDKDFNGQNWILDVLTQYIHLPQEDRRKFQGLHGFSPPGRLEEVRSLLSEGETPSGSDKDHDLKSNEVEFICKVFQLFDTNTWYDGLYLRISRFNHSCKPIVTRRIHWDDADQAEHSVLFALRDIQPGEELTLPYFDTLQPRDERRRSLYHKWGFDCMCTACDQNDSSVDTAAHEAQILEYQRLAMEMDPHLTENGEFISDLSIQVLDESIRRAARRKEILQSLSIAPELILNELPTIGELLRHKWQLTGDKRQIELEIEALEEMITLVALLRCDQHRSISRLALQDRLANARHRLVQDGQSED